MRVLHVMDHPSRINVETDSTWMLMKEAARRRYGVFCCEPGDLYLEGGRVRVKARPVEFGEEPPFFRDGPEQDLGVDSFDLLWMRKDPPFDMNYVFCTYLLDMASTETLVLNNPEVLRGANEKLFPLRWPHLCPETVVTSDPALVAAAVDRMGRVVLKPWNASGGLGVVVSHAGDPNLMPMVELLTGEGRRAMVVQRYLPEVVNGDKRIILVEGVPKGWVDRVPQPGDHRANLHVGAQARACELTTADEAICEAIGPELARLGLLFVGIDVIGGALTEINITSPTGIQEINRLQGTCLEATILDAAEARILRTQGDRS